MVDPGVAEHRFSTNQIISNDFLSIMMYVLFCHLPFVSPRTAVGC